MRERVQPSEVRVEDEEYYGSDFDEKDNRDSIVGNRRLWTRIFHVRPHSIGETRFLFVKN